MSEKPRAAIGFDGAARWFALRCRVWLNGAARPSKGGLVERMRAQVLEADRSGHRA